MKKLILTDCDGVLVDWRSAYELWCRRRNRTTDRQLIYDRESIEEFNHSSIIGCLPPLRDSVEYIKRLESLGFSFHVITCIGSDEKIQKNRQKNLSRLFGKAIDSIVCLDNQDSKIPELLHYQNSGLFWCEDHPDNADDGYLLGLQSILIEHDYNTHHSAPYYCVSSWREIYQLSIKHYSLD